MSVTNAVAPDTMECVLRCLTPLNALACRVSLATGLRISDVLSLRTEQLHHDVISVRERKTGKRRRVQLGKVLRTNLLCYAGKVYVFEGRLDPLRPRTRQAVWRDLKRAQRALRLDGCVAPHSCRKSYAVAKYRACGDMRRVKQLLNHSEEAVTQLYALAAELDSRSKLRGVIGDV